MLSKRHFFRFFGLILATCLFCSAIAYSRYIDWPSIGGGIQIRGIIPEPYPITDAHHYTYRNFMDTWELYRFRTNPETINYLVNALNLSDPKTVYEFPLIVSRPPPYWWHPELLPEALLYGSDERAPDGHLYNLLYSKDTGITYLIRFDG